MTLKRLTLILLLTIALMLGVLGAVHGFWVATVYGATLSTQPLNASTLGLTQGGQHARLW